MPPFVVESPAVDPSGVRRGTMRIYVATEERAREMSARSPSATWREVTEEEMPERARENMRRAE